MLMPPGINGLQTYIEIIAIHPGQKALIVSGFSESSDVKEAMRLGVGGFVKKPYTMEQIARAIKDELARSLLFIQSGDLMSRTISCLFRPLPAVVS